MLSSRHNIDSIFNLLFILFVWNFNAPHRTGLVNFPHPALRPDSLHRRQGIQIVHNAWFGQRVVLQIGAKPGPVERAALTAAVQPLQGQADHQAIEPTKARHITADPRNIDSGPAAWRPRSATILSPEAHSESVSARHSAPGPSDGTSSDSSFAPR